MTALTSFLACCCESLKGELKLTSRALLVFSPYYMQGTVGAAAMVRLWALPWTATLCRDMPACWLPSGLSHRCRTPLFSPACTPELTVLSTQATERPAKRLATPRATLTSSLRMSSHRLLRNLNNLSVYVATPGEKRKGGWWMTGQCAGMFRAPVTGGRGHRWMGHLRQGERSPQPSLKR